MLRQAADARAVVVGTGAEVHVALAAADLLAGEGLPVRVVSMPSWELFAAQDQDYREQVLPPALPSVSVEAGVTMGWEQLGRRVGRDQPLRRLGARRPGAREARDHARRGRRARPRAGRLTGVPSPAAGTWRMGRALSAQR